MSGSLDMSSKVRSMTSRNSSADLNPFTSASLTPCEKDYPHLVEQRLPEGAVAHLEVAVAVTRLHPEAPAVEVVRVAAVALVRGVEPGAAVAVVDRDRVQVADHALLLDRERATAEHDLGVAAVGDHEAVVLVEVEGPRAELDRVPGRRRPGERDAVDAERPQLCLALHVERLGPDVPGRVEVALGLDVAAQRGVARDAQRVVDDGVARRVEQVVDGGV